MSMRSESGEERAKTTLTLRLHTASTHALIARGAMTVATSSDAHQAADRCPAPVAGRFIPHPPLVSGMPPRGQGTAKVQTDMNTEQRA